MRQLPRQVRQLRFDALKHIFICFTGLYRPTPPESRFVSAVPERPEFAFRDKKTLPQMREINHLR
jgi:hypothetical protein